MEASAGGDEAGSPRLVAEEDREQSRLVDVVPGGWLRSSSQTLTFIARGVAVW